MICKIASIDIAMHGEPENVVQNVYGKIDHIVIKPGIGASITWTISPNTEFKTTTQAITSIPIENGFSAEIEAMLEKSGLDVTEQ